MAESRTCKCGAPLPADTDAHACPRCLAKWLEADESEEESLLVDGYKIIEEVGRGGMGLVFKARQQAKPCQIIALKVLRENASSEDIQRFEIEASAAKKLQHPNIVKILNVGFDNWRHFIAMEFIEGQTLKDLVEKGPLTSKLAATYVKTIAEAIQYAHEQEIIHRDLKPANILIDRAGQPRVVDFGLAKQLDQATDITLTGLIAGSPNYMSPEQAGGNRGQVSKRSDIYSLGAVLYHLTTGRPPFVGGTIGDVLQQVLKEYPVDPCGLNTSIPSKLESITLKCLEKDPEKRYATSQALADDLGRFLKGEPTVARPMVAAEKCWRWTKRNPARAVAIGLVVASAVVSTVAALWIAAARDGEAKQRRMAEAFGRSAVSNARQAEANATRAREAQTKAEQAAGEAFAYFRLSNATLTNLVTRFGNSILLRRDPKRFQSEGTRFSVTALKELVSLPSDHPELEAERGALSYFLAGVGTPDLSQTNALVFARQATDIFLGLTNRAPGEARYRRSLGLALDRLAALQFVNAQETDADYNWRQAAAIHHDLRDEFTNEAAHRIELADRQTALARSLVTLR